MLIKIGNIYCLKASSLWAKARKSVGCLVKVIDYKGGDLVTVLYLQGPLKGKTQMGYSVLSLEKAEPKRAIDYVQELLLKNV